MEHEERLRTALADRYSIEREIGSGGMATVYLAQDLKHERKVALKVFRPELSAALGSERFLREIKITASLTHPHILPLLDSGEADGFLFYVMPYVEGDTLRQRMEQEKEMGADDALKITEQVASALAFAHSKGIIHRDIKPENILLQGDQVVVADFGIALALDSAGGDRLTETGLSIGTPAYMSPEQVAGEREIDARSDLYSLACVLYEMLAGDPPFTASNPRAVLAKHLTDPAPPITTVRPGVPAPAATAIAKALQKAQADRFDSVSAFKEALFAKEAKTEPDTKSIVVLPFENLSPDPDNAYFADGLTEELIAELSGVQALRVISRTSAMQFKESKKGVPAIAKELKVRYALEGSVRRAGDSVRITAQLIDASEDSHLWAERYTGKLDDIFDLQEKLARRIVEALRIALTPKEDQRMGSRPFTDLRAWEGWLRARQEMWKFSEEGFNLGIHFLEEARAVAGDVPVLHAALGRIHVHRYEFGISHEPETLRLAEMHASKAVEMDPELGLGLASLAYVRFRQGDWQEMVRLLRRAIEQDRTADSLSMLGFVLAMVGKIEEANNLAAEAAVLDPYDPHSSFFRGAVELMSGEFEVAGSRFQRILDESPVDPAMASFWLAQALAHRGRLDEATRVFAEVSTTDVVALAAISRFFCLAYDGQRDALAQYLEHNPVIVEIADADEWFPNLLAGCFALVGDQEAAIDWLEKGVDFGFSNHRYLETYNPLLKPLREHPRFRQVVEKARKKQEAFDA